MDAHRRSSRVGLRLLLFAALAAPVAVAPGVASAGSPANDHTTAASVGSIHPNLIGVPRSDATGAILGVPAAAGGGAAALRALRRPGASAPARFNLPRWLAARATASRVSRAKPAIAPYVTAAPAPTAAGSAPPGVGLRSELGTFGLSDADDSLLYPDCSEFELCEEPPDPGLAVSADAVVESVNELILMVDRATNASRVIPNFDFFALDNNQTTQSDPRIVYDHTRQRWLATEISSDCSHSYLHIAVSSSDDPFATWTAYRIVFPNRVVDFPGVGTSSTTVVVSLNSFAADPNAPDCLTPGDFEGAMLAVVDWADLVAAAPSLPVTTTPVNAKLFTWRPAVSADPRAHLVVAIDTGAADTSDVGYATVSGSNATHDVALSTVVDLTTTAGLPPFATPPQPRQPGDPRTVESAVDGQPTDAIAAGNRLWFVATAPCTPDNEVTVRDCVRLTELTLGAGPTDVGVVSDSRFQEVGADLFTGGIGRAIDGSFYVVYSRSSQSEVISNWATWRGPAESAFHPPAMITPGAGTYSGARWGDYVILSPDPAALDSVWQADEVPSASGSWFTWLSRLRPAPTGPLSGAVRVNGGDEFVGESFVDLQLTSPAGVAATVVRVANDPALKDGVLAGGQSMPMSADLPWSLDVDQPGDGAPNGERHVYVQWGDGLGHWSDVSSDSIVLDTQGPSMGKVNAPQISASTLGATGTVPVDLHWGGGRDALSGLEGYDVQVATDDGDWEDFGTTGHPSVSGRVAAGHVYAWRVHSFDRLGNVSDWVESKPVRITAVDDLSASLSYSAGWRRSTSGSAYRGGAHATTTAGSSATLAFTGSTFALVSTTSPGRGALDVFVDGRLVGRMSEDSPTTRTGRIGFRWTLTSGRHTIRLVAVDGRRVDIDAVILAR